MSILYVSHHLDEVFELADRVSVLRDAKLVGTVPVDMLDHAGLVEMIVGHRVDTTAATAAVERAAPVVTLRGVHGGNVHGIDLDVAPGEIVGLAGITGSGREHLLGLVGGQLPREQGRHPRSMASSWAASSPAKSSIKGWRSCPPNVACAAPLAR